MSTLPEEIIVEILSLLPVKSLLRFKCVSNPWRNLISSPDFAKLHLKRASEHNAEIDHHTVLMSSSKFKSMNYDPSQSYHFNKIKLDFLKKARKKGNNILGSCDGLIFLSIGFEKLIIWNPSTRYFKVLPKPRSFRKRFAFGGFGFDASIDDYKVIIGIYKHVSVGGRPKRVEVFTLKAKSNTWRKVRDTDIGYPQFRYAAGTLANGALHWLKEDGTIMSFDLAQEQFGKFVAVPDRLVAQTGIYVDRMKLGILQGCLCLYVPDVDLNDDEVWVMKEYGVKSSWSKLLSIPSESTMGYYWTYIRPLCSLRSGEVLLDMEGDQLSVYSTKDKTFKTIRDFRKWYEMVVYEESLVSLY